MAASASVTRFRPGPFIAINVIELLERLAYYGALSVTSLYLASLGYSGGIIGPVLALLLPLPYLVNLVSGPLADRHGYRPALFVAFVTYTAGFLLMGLLTSLWALLTGILLVGVGAGVFKPVPAATISLTTTEAQRNLGFSVYYWAINLGGFLGPVLVALLLHGYRPAFFLAACLTAANIVLSLAVFRDPRPATDRGTQTDSALRTFVTILKDTRFLLLLLVYAGFWMVYSMNFSFVPLYLTDFVPLPAWFTPNLQQSIDPGIVILASLPLGALVSSRNWPPLRVMTAGVLLLTLGFAIVGFSTQWPVFVAGMVVMAIGEILTYPGFLSLVSRLAPPGKAAAYQSAGFLPIGLGFFFGPILNGVLYQSVAQDALRPRLFWSLVCSIGFLTVAGFLLVVQRGPAPGANSTPDRAPTSTAAATQPTRRGRRTGAMLAGLALLAGVALIFAGAVAGTTPRLGMPADAGLAGARSLGHWTGTLAEGKDVDQSFLASGGGASNVTLTLSWTDNTPAGTPPGTVNQPDHFRLQLLDVHGVPLGSTDGSNPPGSFGRISLRATVPAGAVLTARITLLEAGDYMAGPATLGPDTDNTWSLDAREHPCAGCATASS